MSAENQFVCPVPDCGKKYTQASSMRRHSRNAHNDAKITPTAAPGNGRKKCGLCDGTYASTELLCRHLLEAHDKQNMVVSTKEFENETIYRQWLRDESEKGKFSLRKNGNKKGVKEQLICNRSGCYTTKDEPKRAPKMVDGNKKTIKIGFDCSTFVNTKFHDDGHVTVKYCLEHYGHETNAAWLPIPPRIESIVTQMLMDERDPDYIIHKLQETHSANEEIGELLGREHLLSKDDIRNIQNRQGLDTAKLHPDDTTSVRMWVEEHKELLGPDSPLFCYEHDGKYFTLVIQTRGQMKMLKLEGERAVCMDSTHGLTDYNLKLVTIIVLDKRDKGYPVGWLLTTNEDKETLLKFFWALQRRVGNISPDVFMTDCAQSFWNAWKDVFPTKGTKRLWCSWHVKKAWGENIRTKVQVKEHVAYITAMTTHLMHCPNKEVFDEDAAAFLTYLTGIGELDFLNYFKANYLTEDVKPLCAPVKSNVDIATCAVANTAAHVLTINLNTSAVSTFMLSELFTLKPKKMMCHRALFLSLLLPLSVHLFDCNKNLICLK